MIKCIQLYLITVCILLINIVCKTYRDNSYAAYIRNNIHNNHRTKKKIYRRYAQKKKEKESYEEYFKELDKIFNEYDYDADQVEEEEKKKEQELNLITEKDLLEINFCNYEKDPRSLANLVKDKSEEEIEKENIQNDQNDQNDQNNTLEYSYDYDRILKKKKFLKEKIEYKDKFILNENHNKLINNIDTSFMNDFLNNYKNDFNKPFYKARRDQYFAREDLTQDEIKNNNQMEYKEGNIYNNSNNYIYDDEEKKVPYDHKISKDDQNNEDLLNENLESVLFLKRIRNTFDIERNIYINDSIKDIKEKYDNQGDKTNIWNNINDNDKGRDEENRFHKYFEEKIKNANTDENIDKLILKKYINMFSIDEEVLNINEKIKKCENVHSILEIFKENKRINIINIMYAFIYIDRFKCLNITEYLYEKRFAYITYALEEIMKYYLYVLNKKGLKDLYKKKNIKNLNNINEEDTQKKNIKNIKNLNNINEEDTEKQNKIHMDDNNNNESSNKDNNYDNDDFERRTLQLNDKNLIFLIKYMNKLKLFYININLYNMFFLILSKSFPLCSANSFVILLSYMNEYNYYNNNIHKKINISILNEVFHIFKRDGIKSSGLNFAHFKILLPLLIKYKYVNNNIFKLLYLYFEKDIKNMMKTLTSNIKKKERKEICNVLFYDVKTKEQEKNKEKYLSYLKYEEMKEKKESMEILSQLLNYLMICKFNEEDTIVLKLIEIFIDYMHLLDVDQLLNIFFNYHIFQYSNEKIIYRCKQELLNRKSLLKDYHINKILSFIIYNYRKAEIYRNYYRHWFNYKNYIIYRNHECVDTISSDENITQKEHETNKMKKKNTQNNINDKKENTPIENMDNNQYDNNNNSHNNSNNNSNNSYSRFHSFYDNLSEEGNVKKLPSNISFKEVLEKRKEIKQFKKDYYINKKIFKDIEFIYDLTHDIHIYVSFKNVHLLKLVYSIYLLSLLFYKNMDVLRIASEIAYDLTDTNIFSFIDQYSYYLYDDIYIVIKTFKYISFFSMDLIDIWKKFFFLLNHFVNNLNLENIYDIFFFIHIAKITNLKNENYDVFHLLTSRMKNIVKILFTHNIKNFNTYPHTYILNILNMINDEKNEHVTDFLQYFFYSIYKRIQYLSSHDDNMLADLSYYKDKMDVPNTNIEDNMKKVNNKYNEDDKYVDDNKSVDDNINSFNNNIKIDRFEKKHNNIYIFSNKSDTKNKESNNIYKNVNNYIYNFKDIRLFIKIFLRYYKQDQENFNLQIVDFILYNSEVFFFNMWTNRRYYQRHYFFGNEIKEFLHLLKELIQNKLYNSNIMYRCVNIFKYIINIQSTINIQDISNIKCNLYSNFFLHFDNINDVNLWKYIRKVFLIQSDI
ncbi:conserved Plasmodium protein, unknown function [Plasmodium sp. DRC-Itaito]|nr:conserved Plasmodium protein, unknown function [Plasmodium sp. DRC-Itaito]